MVQDVAQSFGQTQAVELATESLVHIEERVLAFGVAGNMQKRCAQHGSIPEHFVTPNYGFEKGFSWL